eukprot:85751_1
MGNALTANFSGKDITYDGNCRRCNGKFTNVFARDKYILYNHEKRYHNLTKKQLIEHGYPLHIDCWREENSKTKKDHYHTLKIYCFWCHQLFNADKADYNYCYDEKYHIALQVNICGPWETTYVIGFHKGCEKIYKNVPNTPDHLQLHRQLLWKPGN